MQFPNLAEVKIILDKQIFATANYKDTKLNVSVPLIVEKKKRGLIEVIYHKNNVVDVKRPFLPEEKKLLTAVAQELSHIVKRVAVENEKQTLQLQLQHAERLAFVGELTAGIAHELNEPLGRILGFAQLIRKSGEMGNQQNEDIERIIKASLYTREIIKKLMIFSRQMPQQIISVNLNEIISNILYFIDVRYQSQKIKIQQKLSSTLPLIRADPVQLSQVVVNLVTNAIHAMPAGGDLTISTGRLREEVKLTVTDNGHGMTPDMRKKIFQPFFTTKPIGQGTGLGLSVVQGIVTSHHGKINVLSTVGKGSKFEIILPIKQ
jgi:two-component system, NtrC family, sensor kinase